jgi:hypothetical protein
MEQQQKESYAEPVLIAHELLRDVTGVKYREQCQKAVDAVCAD